jgi:hypothetical protein
MARLVFFRWTPTGYVGDDDGLLVGTGWSDEFGNGFRAIVFLPDLSELKYQRSVQFFYDLEIQAEGQPAYIHSATKTLTLSNDVLVEYDPATAVLGRLFSRNAPRAEPTATDPVGQLDLFIGLYWKGTIAPPAAGLVPIYEWLTDLIIEAEVPTAPPLSSDTLALIAFLAALGITLTEAQQHQLDELMRALEGTPMAAAQPFTSGYRLPPQIKAYLLDEGYAV